MNDIEWKKQAKNMLKAELQRKGVTYENLVDKLKAIGVHENYNSVNTKLNRGSFTFVFATGRAGAFFDIDFFTVFDVAIILTIPL